MRRSSMLSGQPSGGDFMDSVQRSIVFLQLEASVALMEKPVSERVV